MAVGYRSLSVLTASLVRGGTAGWLLLWLVLVRAEPLTRYLTVVQGASTMLSWSMPIMFAPLRSSTPMTRKETLLMRISLPSGDASGNSFPLHGVADDADLVAVADVAVGEHFALAIFFQSRTSRNDGVVPVICSGTQLRLPRTICAGAHQRGDATARRGTAGRSRRHPGA